MHLPPAISYPQTRRPAKRCRYTEAGTVFGIQAEKAVMEGAEHWTRFSAVQFKPGRTAVGANQHEHELAARTYSAIFGYIGSAGLWPRSGQAAGASI